MKIYDLDDNVLARRIQKEWKSARSVQSDWRDETKEDFNFVAGHQWADDDLTKLKEEKRPPVTFNRCNPIVSAIIGMEANQRQETKYVPRENSDSPIADATTQIVNWVRDYGEIDIEDSMAFENMLTCGMGWSEIFMNYDTDLDGKICLETIPSLEMAWDTSAIKRNLTDSKWSCRGKKMTSDEILERWPDADIEIITDQTEMDSPSVHVNNAPNFYQDENGTSGSPDKKETTILHFSWYESVPVYRAPNPQTGQIEKISNEDYKNNKEAIKLAESLGIRFVKQQERKYYQAFVYGDTLLEKGVAPCQTGLHYKCMTGKRDHIKNEWYGIVRMMKDPQRWANKFFSQFMDIIAANSKGGVIVEETALGNKAKEFERDWAKTDKISIVSDGTISGGRIMPKPSPNYPQATDRVMQFSISSIYDTTGVNLEILGMADRDQAGIVEESRKKSSYTILAPYFDSLKSYRKQTGLALLEYIINYIPISRITQVLEPEMQPLAQSIKQLDTRSINVIVAESPQSDNNKLITWSFMTQILPVLIKMGVPIPPEIIEYSPLPATLTAKWVNLMKQSQQPSPEKQMQQQMMMADKQAQIQHTQSQSALNQAKSQESQVNAQQKVVETIRGKNVFGP